MSKIVSENIFRISNSSSSSSISIYQGGTDSSSSSSSTIDENKKSFDDLLKLVEKLRFDLNVNKKAKQQLASLYKIKCKSDLDKSAKLTKLRLHFEEELNRFCKIDQEDLVRYLNRQILQRDQQIAEKSYELERLRNSIPTENLTKKIESIEILHNVSQSEIVRSTIRRSYDERERSLQRQNIELKERLKKIETSTINLEKDHDKEFLKRALAKQASDYQKMLTSKEKEIEQLNDRIEQFVKSNPLELALRQSNIEKLYLEKRLLSSTSSTNSPTTTTTTMNLPSNRPTTRTTSTSTETTNERSSSPIDPLFHQSVQKSNEILKIEVQRLATLVEENTSKLNKKLEQYEQLEKSYKVLLEHDEQKKNVESDDGSNFRHFHSKISQLEIELNSSRDQFEKLSEKFNFLLAEQENQRSHHDRSNELEKLVENLRNQIQSNAQIHQNELKIQENFRDELNKTIENLSDECRKLKEENRTLIDDCRKLKEENRTLNEEKKSFEKFQRSNFENRENEIVHQLQEKIMELERKSEVQSRKYKEILVELSSIKESQELKDDSVPHHWKDPRRIRLVRAKYFYEPMKSSPNEHPEMELPLKNGELYLIHGDADEDGFFDGQNFEGRYGLIPSNFVELVSTDNESEKSSSSESNVEIPSGSNLRVEKIFSSNVTLSWSRAATNSKIFAYRIILDRKVLKTIRGDATPRATIKLEVNQEKRFRISIETISNRGVSSARRCTLLVDRNERKNFSPTDLRVEKLASRSALLSWWPISNEVSHRLSVNDVELKIIEPEIYRLKIFGLAPNSIHKFSLETLHVEGVNNTAFIEFRTPPDDDQISEDFSFSSNDEKSAQIDLKIVENRNFRRVRALFDYEPDSMSPNPDKDREISFKRGEIIEIFNEKDEDGFFYGKNRDGREGLVPSNLLSSFDDEKGKSTNENFPRKNSVEFSDSQRDEFSLESKSENVENDLNSSKISEKIEPNEIEKNSNEENRNDEPERNSTKRKKSFNAEKPMENSETNKIGIFDRLKNTFSWNSNEPI